MKLNFFKLTIEHLWVLLVLGSCFGYLCIQPVDQFDFWHYIKAGDIMLNTGKFLTRDQFSFTMNSQRYINIHWFSEIIYSLLYRFGGVQLIIFTHASIITLSFGLLLSIIYDKVKNIRIASVVVFIAFVLSSTNLTLRPQGFSILFFMVTFYLLHKKYLYFIPIIIFMWTNIHAAFIVGLILIGIEWITSLKRSLFFTFVFSCLATLLNPYGYKYYELILSVEPISRNLCRIAEWETPSFHEATGFRFYLALLILVALLNFKKSRWIWSELLTFLCFTTFAFSSLRTVLWWAFISAPLFASAIKEFLPTTNIQVGAKEGGKNNLFLNWCVALLFITYTTSFLPWFKTSNLMIPFKKRPLLVFDTPVDISEKLKTLPSVHNIYNDFAWGSYFIWALREDQKVFYDPRAAIFPQKVISDYFTVFDGDYRWQEVLDKYKVDTLALNKEEQDKLIPQVKSSSLWKQIYEDKLGYIFIRKNM